LNTSFGTAISQRHNSFFYYKINDHACWGNTGQILAGWRRPVASKVALDLPHWAMCSALYRLIRMDIEMAREGGAFCSVVGFMSFITVAKRPWYGQLKKNPSYTIVCYYVYIEFVCYGNPPTAINAFLAIIAGGGQAIAVIEREAVEINNFLL
jgi:hypothetical protein